MALTGWITLLHYVPLLLLPASPAPGLHAFIQVQYQFLWWTRMRSILGNALSYLHGFLAVYSSSSAKQGNLPTLKTKKKKKMSSCGKKIVTERKGVYQT